jgi:hypothetical protein
MKKDDHAELETGYVDNKEQPISKESLTSSFKRQRGGRPWAATSF